MTSSFDDKYSWMVPFLFFVCAVLLVLFWAKSEYKCDKAKCPPEMSPHLVRGSGCICLVEAK